MIYKNLPVCIGRFSPGYYPFRQQPGVPLAVWMDGPSQDLTAEAHPGRDHQETLRTAPRGAGHAGTHEAPAGCHHALPSGHKRRTHMWTPLLNLAP